jgi:hypothetical protein
MIPVMKSKRGSILSKIDMFGSTVQNKAGEHKAVLTVDRDNKLNKVLFPTFVVPMIPIFKFIEYPPINFDFDIANDCDLETAD